MLILILSYFLECLYLCFEILNFRLLLLDDPLQIHDSLKRHLIRLLTLIILYRLL